MTVTHETETPTVWQLAAGPSSRPFADVLLKYGIALLGPGDPGPWKAEREDGDFEGGFVRRFASELKVRDVILLRTGTSRISAVGLVASEYIYLSQFDDVNGLDVQHARRVRWSRLPSEYDFGKTVFGGNPTRFSRVWDEDVINYGNRFLSSPPTYWQSASLPELPEEEPALEQLPAYLEGHLAEVHDLAPLFWDEQSFGDLPTEDELIAHFIVPFLRSLGWPPELIAVKWRYVDVTVFKKLPRTPKNCLFVIEAKRLGAGVEGALEQAKGYVAAQTLECDVVVTDGIRYRMYCTRDNFAHLAYANLLRLKKSAADLFLRMKRQS